MTIPQIVDYLTRNKDILSLNAIARNSGFKNLSKVISGSVDGHGNAFTFPEKYREAVAKEINRLRK